MKVREKQSGMLFGVYGIYWQGDKTYFCCFPKKSTGLSAYGEGEVEIVERSVGADFEFVVTANQLRGIFHRHLIGDKLLDDLFEHDPTAYRRFVTLLGRDP